MSCPESIVAITNKLSLLKEKVDFSFNMTDKSDITSVKIKIILDVVFLKREILLCEKTLSKDSENKVKLTIEDFKLESVEENNLFNISTLNFDFYNNEKQIIDSKTLIIQIIKDKGEVYKNII